MNASEFRKFAIAAVDYVTDYLENVRDRPVLPSVNPGYLQELIPKEAPQHPEKWQDILSDMERVIMPGITHWQSPQFHAYFPSANSYPSIVGEILTAGIACMGFNWNLSPACTELEVIMMDWLAKLIGLPEQFFACSGGTGGGVIQGSASESTLVAILAARECAVKKVKEMHPDWDVGTIRAKLVAYSSDEANSSVEKAGVLGAVIMRLLPSDDKCRLQSTTLEAAIKHDREEGLIPFFVVATLGTTETCAFDCLNELGPVCTREGVWLHVDAAYAGAAFICPEYRHILTGVEHAHSFCFNPHKWLLVNFDCSAMWLKDSKLLVEAFNVDRIYLRHKNQGLSPDYRDWQIQLGRKFRSLKLWLVLRCYGVEGLQNYIRHHAALAQEFEELVQKDERFEVNIKAVMGLVCFRLKGPDQLTKQLHERLMARKKIYVIAATFQGNYIIRFVLCSRFIETKDIIFAWDEIRSQTDQIFKAISDKNEAEKPPAKHDTATGPTVVKKRKSLTFQQTCVAVDSNNCEAETKDDQHVKTLIQNCDINRNGTNKLSVLEKNTCKSQSTNILTNCDEGVSHVNMCNGTNNKFQLTENNSAEGTEKTNKCPAGICDENETEKVHWPSQMIYKHDAICNKLSID